MFALGQRRDRVGAQHLPCSKAQRWITKAAERDNRSESAGKCYALLEVSRTVQDGYGIWGHGECPARRAQGRSICPFITGALIFDCPHIPPLRP